MMMDNQFNLVGEGLIGRAAEVTGNHEWILSKGLSRDAHPPEGTTRPTHYHVLHDEIGFSADDMQELIHSISYVLLLRQTVAGLDETMTYSCAIFKSEEEDLKVAQERKISFLIEKAKISKEHHVLEIGCGWGSLAVEVVKRTGCKYTGIILSEQQLKYAHIRVKQAGLKDHITFLLCDYRQLPNMSRYDRIISCEMLEAVGHEFMEEFLTCCESALAEDGLLVLQFISIPDERYDEYRQSSDIIKEYIFPGIENILIERVEGDDCHGNI